MDDKRSAIISPLFFEQVSIKSSIIFSIKNNLLLVIIKFKKVFNNLFKFNFSEIKSNAAACCSILFIGFLIKFLTSIFSLTNLSIAMAWSSISLNEPASFPSSYNACE